MESPAVAITVWLRASVVEIEVELAQLLRTMPAAGTGGLGAADGGARFVAHVEDDARFAGEALAAAEGGLRIVRGRAGDLLAIGEVRVAPIGRDGERARPCRLHDAEILRDFALGLRRDGDGRRGARCRI